MATPEALFVKRKIFEDNDGRLRLREDHAEGATIFSVAATVLVVRDQFVSTVCSGCLQSKGPQSSTQLQRCSKCKFLNYCSRACQTLNWKRCHRDECDMLKAVWKSCPNQDTSFARLFARGALFTNHSLKASGMLPVPFLATDFILEQEAEQCLKLVHQTQNCRKLFYTWKPILKALDRHFSTNIRQFAGFIRALTDLIGVALPVFASNDCRVNFSQEPIAYGLFLNLYKTAMYTPSSVPNAVFVPVVDPVHGPILQVRAVRPIKAGEEVFCAEASNLLVSPMNLRSQGAYVMKRAVREAAEKVYIAERTEMLCAKCGDKLTVTELRKGLFVAMENLPFLDLGCGRCGFSIRSHGICELLIHKMAKLTSKTSNHAEQSENQLMVQLGGLKDLIGKLHPMVAKTSFALGILYKELADIYEVLGRMDKCVEAYKMLMPIVEKHLHKYDQNVFDGLSRLIVYHLERQEIAESLPFIEISWERLQKIPGRDSFDFHVVDKLRKAVRNKVDFTFSKFCSVEPA